MPGARSDEQAVSTLRCGCEPGPPPTPEYERRNDARASPGPWEGHVQCQGRARQVGLRMFASGFGEHLSQSQRGVCVQGACCPAQVCGGDRDQGRQTCPLSLRPPPRGKVELQEERFALLFPQPRTWHRLPPWGPSERRRGRFGIPTRICDPAKTPSIPDAHEYSNTYNQTSAL